MLQLQLAKNHHVIAIGIVIATRVLGVADVLYMQLHQALACALLQLVLQIAQLRFKLITAEQNPSKAAARRWP